jgi:hypothetical protein
MLESLRFVRKKGQEPLPERPEGCFAQRFLTAFPDVAMFFGLLAPGAVLAGVVGAWSGDHAPARVATAFPGGFLDPTGKVVYVQSALGGIEAVSLESGKVLWNTEAFVQPLALLGNKLIVQAPEKGKANVIRILALNVKDKGKQLSSSDPIMFPEWVNTGTVHGRTFQSTFAGEANNIMWLNWQARAFYAGGARPTPEIEKAARKEASGHVDVDLQSGKVKMSEGQKGSAGEQKLPIDLDKLKSDQYWTGSSWETKPLIVDSKVVTLSLERRGMEEVLTLHTWDKSSGMADKPIELMRGKSLWKMLSTHRKQLFVHQALVAEKLPKGDYAWWVFDLTNGKQLAKMPFEVGVAGMLLHKKSVYYVTDQTKFGGPKGGQRNRVLKAIDVASGKMVWDRPIYAPPVLLPLP